MLFRELVAERFQKMSQQGDKSHHQGIYPCLDGDVSHLCHCSAESLLAIYRYLLVAVLPYSRISKPEHHNDHHVDEKPYRVEPGYDDRCQDHPYHVEDDVALFSHDQRIRQIR